MEITQEAKLYTKFTDEQSRAMFNAVGIPIVSPSATMQNNWLRKHKIYIGQQAQDKYPEWAQ